jgi:hypothetical protein
MLAWISLSQVQEFIANHSNFLPVTGLTCSGLAIALLRAPLDLRPFGISDSESIMNFSSLGTLRCVCGAEHREDPTAERRQFCRSCGCELIETDRALLHKELTRREIRAITRQLRTAGIRARNLDLPPSITSIEDLNRYLAGSPSPSKLPPPSRPATVEQPKVH